MYKWHFLTTIGVDDSNQLFLVAFCFVEIDNIDSW
jgi:hypothetical protein